jgi:DNA-binding transcriptional ArsR family regulator
LKNSSGDRLKILQALYVGPQSVGEIVAATAATQSNISKQFALLASAGIITRHKDGQFADHGVSNRLGPKLCDLVHK